MSLRKPFSKQKREHKKLDKTNCIFFSKSAIRQQMVRKCPSVCDSYISGTGSGITESGTPSASTEADNQLCSRRIAVVEEHLEELSLPA